MKRITSSFAVLAALVLPFTAAADLVAVKIVPVEGSHAPATLGGYEMTSFASPALPGPSGCPGTGYDYGDDPMPGVYSVESPTGGNVEFRDQDGTPLCMSVDDPDWWGHDNHGNVFTTTENWVELIMPANTRAFSLFVGGVSGSGWIQAQDSNHTMTDRYGFSNLHDHTPGFGVYSTGECSTITKIIIEPWEWGTGHFAINQGACGTEVPEPAPMMLLLTGLFGLALSRRFKNGAPEAS